MSVHDPVQKMYERLKEDEMSNVFDRFDPQEKIRCEFCRAGVSCQLCTHGPCRISDRAGAVLGVCGIDRNALAMRDLLIRNVMGAAIYTHHAYQAFRTLKSTAEGKTPFHIADPEKLVWLVDLLNVPTSGDVNQMAFSLGDFLTGQLHHDYDEPSPMVEVFAPEAGKKLWRELAIYPAGVMYEISDATASCLTNVDGDHTSLAKKAMRLGIASVYTSQIGLALVQDILFGAPAPHEVDVDLDIMDPDYVNIVFNGHQPWTAVATIAMARDLYWQEKAREAGAEGLRVAGSIETGQGVLQRFPVDEVFVGLTGNWLTIEPLLATGTVDVFAMDENCSPPNLAPYADKYQVTLVSVNDLVRMPGLKIHLDCKPPEAENIAQQLIDLAIENFRKRHGQVTPRVPEHRTKAIAGFCTEAVLGALGGGMDPLLDAVKKGQVRGIVALINCTTLANGPHDQVTVDLVQELVRRDILVVSAGCGNHGLEVAGLATLDAAEMAGPGLSEVCRTLHIPPVLSFGTCSDTGRISTLVTAVAEALNTDTFDLPVAVTAPQWLEQKATMDAIFALAYGMYTHLSPVPAITGAEDLVQLLTEDVEELTGGKVGLADDPVQAADNIEEHIVKKRASLGLE